MRSPRLTLAVTALSAALALTACSDDGGDEADESPTTAGSDTSESPTIYPVDGCQAEVAVTGVLKVAWKGNAQNSPSGEATLFQSSDGKKSWIAATTAAGDDPAAVTVTVKGTSYQLGKNAAVDETESGATVSGTVQVQKGQTAKVEATFDCQPDDGSDG